MADEEAYPVARRDQRVEIVVRVILDVTHGRIEVGEPKQRSVMAEAQASPTAAVNPATTRATEWLTASQAAAYAKLRVNTIRAACCDKRLDHIRLGGSPVGPIRTMHHAIDKWLAGIAHADD